jgi:hypothetical protein
LSICISLALIKLSAYKYFDKFYGTTLFIYSFLD